MAMRGFELLLIVHLVYIQVPSGSTMTTSSGARTTATPAPPPTTEPRPTTTPLPTSPPTTNTAVPLGSTMSTYSSYGSSAASAPPPTSAPRPTMTTNTAVPLGSTMSTYSSYGSSAASAPPPTSAPRPTMTTNMPLGSTMTSYSSYGSSAASAPPPTSVPRPTMTTNNSAGEACPAVDVCFNGGICEDGPASGEPFMCRCPYGTTGRYCETACVQRKVDLLLIEDASPSVTKTEDYAAMKEFEVQLINDTRINLSLLHVAEVVFGKEAEVGFHLNTFQDKRSALAAIANATKEHGPTFLNKAVKIADINVFSEKNGDRTDADNVVIVFTDGRSRNTMNVMIDAGGLRRKAVIYVVALTKSQAIGTMKDVASSSSHVFTDRQKALKDISDSLTELTCQSEGPGRR